MPRKTLPLTILGLLLVFALISLAELRSTNWDWDIDHRMYFGSRLLHGELIWTREYDDKLPLMQFLFAIPALARSVRVWQLMSLAMVLSAAYGIFLWLDSGLKRVWKLTAGQSTRIALVTACLYPYLIAVLPGSISHHNSATASIFTLGMIASLPALNSSHSKLAIWSPWTMRYCIAALLMASAISLRPYYLLPGLLAAPWQTARDLVQIDRPLQAWTATKAMVLRSTQWAGTIALIGLLLNVLPYALSGNISAFRNGLMLLSQDTLPFQLGSMLKIQASYIFESRFLVFFAFALPPLLSIGILTQIFQRRHNFKIPLHWSRVQAVDILFACLLMPLSLEWIILTKHYFPHYQQLFVPLVTLAFAMFLASLTKSLSTEPISISPHQSKVLSVFIALLILTAFGTGLTAPLSNLLHPPLERRIASVAKLSPKGEDGPLGESFLFPSSMYIHWKLNQSRHSFPHAALTGFIHGGFWKDAKIPASLGFPFPTNTTEYCDQLKNHGPQKVIDTAESPSIQCLRTDVKATYVKRREFLLPTGESTLHLYERSSLPLSRNRLPR